jgi:hypothetical protein
LKISTVFIHYFPIHRHLKIILYLRKYMYYTQGFARYLAPGGLTWKIFKFRGGGENFHLGHSFEIFYRKTFPGATPYLPPPLCEILIIHDIHDKNNFRVFCYRYLRVLLQYCSVNSDSKLTVNRFLFQ